MTDQNTAQLNKDTDGGAKKGVVEISETELAELRAARDEKVRLEQIAKEAGADSVKEYLEGLEDDVVSLRDEMQKHAKPKDDKGDEGQKNDPPPQSVGLDEATKQLLSQSQSTSVNALMTSARAEFRVIDGTRPDGERCPYKMSDLEKVIREDAPIIAKLLKQKPDLEGNIFMAAEYVKDMNEGRPRKKTDDKINDAGGSANLNTGGRAPKPDADDKVPDEVLDAEKVLRERIAPTGGAYFGD